MNWISVDDNVPEVGQRVIVATPVDDESWQVTVGHFRPLIYHAGIAVIDMEGGGWRWISHWMPLPAPPALQPRAESLAMEPVDLSILEEG